MIAPICDACRNELMVPGALVFSPPNDITRASDVKKYHLCSSCWSRHFVVFTDDGWTVEHPFDCRLSGDMANCLYSRLLNGYDDGGLRGRYPMTATSSESFALGGRIAEPVENRGIQS